MADAASPVRDAQVLTAVFTDKPSHSWKDERGRTTDVKNRRLLADGPCLTWLQNILQSVAKSTLNSFNMFRFFFLLGLGVLLLLVGH